MISRNECDSYTCLSEKKVRMFAVCFWPLGTKISFILSKLKWLYSGFWTYSVNLGRSYSIEAWIPKGPLHACGVPHKVDNRNPQQSNSYLYNAMLHPLLRLSIKKEFFGIKVKLNIVKRDWRRFLLLNWFLFEANIVKYTIVW